MQVKKLEEEIGVRIFDRDKKPLQPTDIGQKVILRARQILRETKQLKEFVTHEKEVLEGDITIGIIPTLAPYLLPRFLPEYSQNNPRIHLKLQELQTAQIIFQLQNGMIDLGILVTPLNESGIREIPLFYEPFLLYLPKKHRFLDQKLMLTEDLDPSEVLVLDEGHCFRDQALSICKQAKYDSSLGFDYQSGSIEGLKSLVKKGIGYTLVPELSVINELNSVHIRRFSHPEPVREVSMVVHNNFIKESLIQSLKTCIQKNIPKKFIDKAEAVVDIGWR